MARYPELNVGVVLDNDVGGDIGVIINKCKNPVFVRLTAKARAHGSTPWDGLTPTMLMRTIAGSGGFIRIFDINSGKPANTWIDTMHAARIMRRRCFQHHFRAGGGAVGYPADGDING